MDVEHRVDQVGGHVVKRLVAEDAGIVDDDVNLAVGVGGGLDDRFASFRSSDRVGVGNGVTTGCGDLVDNQLRCALVTARTVDGTAEVVHHDECTSCRHHQCVLPTQATAGAGDDCYFAVESKISHRN